MVLECCTKPSYYDLRTYSDIHVLGSIVKFEVFSDKFSSREDVFDKMGGRCLTSCCSG